MFDSVRFSKMPRTSWGARGVRGQGGVSARQQVAVALTAASTVSVLVFTAFAVPATSQQASAARSVKLNDTTLLYGQRAQASGDVGAGSRRVTLQRRSSSGWDSVVSASSASTGRFAITDPQSRVGVYRIYAPRARVGGKVVAAWVSSVLTATWQSSITAPATLQGGQGMRSSSGKFLAVMQYDGNMVVYDQSVSPQKASWNSATQGQGLRFTVQADGNMVVYDGSAPKWSSDTAPAGSTRLVMQDDGNLVLYSRGGIALWGSYQGKLPNTADTISARTTLAPGQALYSRDNRHRAEMQRDGNFVVYGPGGAEWSTGTNAPGSSLTLQEDGNLVVYSDGVAKWFSDTVLARTVRLVMQDDGNLVMYSRGNLALWSSRSGKSGYGEDTLPTGASLSTGLGLWSHDGRYQAVMQGDGNFVVYGPSGAVWSTGTGNSDSSVHMQTDGNLVVYAPGGVAKWTSNSSGQHAALVMQDDGNLVVYSGGRALWSSAGNGAPGTGAPATDGYPDADAVDCSRTYGIYSWCKGGNWAHPTRRFAYRNCTDYVAWRRSMTWSQIEHGGSGHAYKWKAGWESRGRATGTTPRVGAVAYWPATDTSKFGHVAYVVSVNPDGSAHVAEYNRSGQGTYGERDVRAPTYLY